MENNDRNLLTAQEGSPALDKVLWELDRLFDETELEYLRLYLWSFIKSTIAPDFFRFNGQPVIVLEAVAHLGQIIDLFEELRQEHKAASEDMMEGSDLEHMHLNRRYMLDLDLILSTYGGHIRRLRREEIDNLYLVAQQFFEADASSQWKEELKYLQYFALSKESVCVASDDIRLLERYELLEKLLEAAYLLHKRRSMIGGPEQEPSPEKETADFRSLKKEGVTDPLSYICRYFCDTTLGEQLTEMKDWIQAVFGRYVWHERSPSELVWFHDETIKLIEAAYWLYGEKKAGVNRENRQYDKPFREPSGYRIYPHYLNEKEEADPWLVLRQLSETDLDEIKERLRDWLTYSLNARAIEDHRDDIYFYHLLQKLAEALYIIAVQVSKADENESETLNTQTT